MQTLVKVSSNRVSDILVRIVYDYDSLFFVLYLPNSHCWFDVCLWFLLLLLSMFGGVLSVV